MKNFLRCFLFPAALALLVSLSACGGKESSSSEPTPSPSPVPSASPSASPTAAPSASPTAKPTQKPESKPESSASESQREPESPEEEPEYSEPDPVEEPDSQPEPEPTPEPEPEPEEPQANPSDFINQDVSALYAVFGQPNGADYGPSCLGSGEDGVLYYDSFTVYTYKDESGERILDVG